MGSREPKHLSCPTHGAVWGTIYADGAVDYDCGCHATHTPPAPADDASGAKPVAWAVRDRHGQYGEPSRDEAKIRRDCDYLNRDSSTPYYIGQGPYEVVPLAPLPAPDDAVEEARATAKDVVVALIEWAAPKIASKNGAIRQDGHVVMRALKETIDKDSLAAAEADAKGGA